MLSSRETGLDPNNPTLGQRRVRVSFNPSEDKLVATIKRRSADLIDICEDVKRIEGSPEAVRCAELAQTAYEEAAMWAVKAATA
jgi:hypothetical protein